MNDILTEKQFFSPLYRGRYEVSGSAGQIKNDPNDRLPIWLRRNSMSISRNVDMDGDAYLVIDAHHDCASVRPDRIVNQHPSIPKEGDEVQYQRVVRIIRPNGAHIPALLDTILTDLNYTRV